MRWPKTFRRIQGLSDVLLLLNLLVSVLNVVWLLGHVPLPDLLRRFATGKAQPFSIRRVKNSIRFLSFIVSLLCLRNPCLLRALILFRYLRAAGIDVKIVFGAGVIDDRFGGHAWLEYRNRMILEGNTARAVYPVVFRYPGVQAGSSK